MDPARQQEQQTSDSQENQGQTPIQVTHTHGVLTITVTFITDIQDLIYADGTQEQIGNERAELRITLDRDTYIDDYTHVDPSGVEEQVELPSSRTTPCQYGHTRSRSY